MSLFDKDLIQKELPGVETAAKWVESEIKRLWEIHKNDNLTDSQFSSILMNAWLPGEDRSYNKNLAENYVRGTSTRVERMLDGFHVSVKLNNVDNEPFYIKSRVVIMDLIDSENYESI